MVFQRTKGVHQTYKATAFIRSGLVHTSYSVYLFWCNTCMRYKLCRRCPKSCWPWNMHGENMPHMFAAVIHIPLRRFYGNCGQLWHHASQMHSSYTVDGSDGTSWWKRWFAILTSEWLQTVIKGMCLSTSEGQHRIIAPAVVTTFTVRTAIEVDSNRASRGYREINSLIDRRACFITLNGEASYATSKACEGGRRGGRKRGEGEKDMRIKFLSQYRASFIKSSSWIHLASSNSPGLALQSKK